MPSHRDKIEQDLFAELARLRQRMQEIHEQGGCQDPDKVMAELESEARCINQMTEKIIHEIEAVSPKHADLNTMADEAAKELERTAAQLRRASAALETMEGQT